MAIAWSKFDDFIAQIGKGVHHLHAAGDTLKVYLSNELPLITDTVKADVAEITNEHGYTAPVDIQNDYSQVGGTGTMTMVNVVITASGGTVGPFRYAVVYNDSAASDNLVGYWDRGIETTLQDGDSVTFGPASGSTLLTVAMA